MLGRVVNCIIIGSHDVVFYVSYSTSDSGSICIAPWVEERLTIELVDGREVEKVVTTITKNGVVTRMMIYWEQVEYEVSDDDDSDLESTARSVPKDYELGYTSSSSGI
ncbi:hypothetical protein Tco_0478410 [Tanacetum coccineum]